MSGILTSVNVLCASLFTASLIKMLAPGGKTEKMLKTVISVFVILCLVFCIKSVVSEYKAFENSHFDSSDNLNSEIDRNVLIKTGDYLVEYTDSLLCSHYIDAQKIMINVDADEKGVIYITEISIYLDKEAEAHTHRATEIIENDFNITPKIIYGE